MDAWWVVFQPAGPQYLSVYCLPQGTLAPGVRNRVPRRGGEGLCVAFHGVCDEAPNR